MHLEVCLHVTSWDYLLILLCDCAFLGVPAAVPASTHLKMGLQWGHSVHPLAVQGAWHQQHVPTWLPIPQHLHFVAICHPLPTYPNLIQSLWGNLDLTNTHIVHTLRGMHVNVHHHALHSHTHAQTRTTPHMCAQTWSYSHSLTSSFVLFVHKPLHLFLSSRLTKACLLLNTHRDSLFWCIIIYSPTNTCSSHIDLSTHIPSGWTTSLALREPDRET